MDRIVQAGVGAAVPGRWEFRDCEGGTHDIDTVILLPVDFQKLVDSGAEAALELEEMLLTRRPEEIFAAEDDADWEEWVAFSSRTREAGGRRKGLVEIRL